MHSALKTFAKAVAEGKPAAIAKAQTEAMSAIDIAAKKAVIHRNKASRVKSKLAKQAKDAGVKPTKAASPKSKVGP